MHTVVLREDFHVTLAEWQTRNLQTPQSLCKHKPQDNNQRMAKTCQSSQRYSKVYSNQANAPSRKNPHIYWQNALWHFHFPSSPPLAWHSLGLGEVEIWFQISVKPQEAELICDDLTEHRLKNWSLFYRVQNSVMVKHPNLDLRLEKGIGSDGYQPQKLQHKYRVADVWGSRTQVKACTLDQTIEVHQGRWGGTNSLGNLDFEKLHCIQGN